MCRFAKVVRVSGLTHPTPIAQGFAWPSSSIRWDPAGARKLTRNRFAIGGL